MLCVPRPEPWQRLVALSHCRRRRPSRGGMNLALDELDPTDRGRSISQNRRERQAPGQSPNVQYLQKLRRAEFFERPCKLAIVTRAFFKRFDALLAVDQDLYGIVNIIGPCIWRE